jgi:hypothetical protein
MGEDGDEMVLRFIQKRDVVSYTFLINLDARRYEFRHCRSLTTVAPTLPAIPRQAWIMMDTFLVLARLITDLLTGK